MYQRFGAELIAAASDDPLVSIVAARREDGALTLMIVNRGAAPADMPLTFAGLTPAVAETLLFDKEHAAEQIDPTPLGKGARLRLPPESMSLLIVPARP
jgi:hypothetical protein